MEPIPIPLKSLTILLNRERMLSDPRFKNVALRATTMTDAAMLERNKRHVVLRAQVDSVRETHLHVFKSTNLSEEEQSATYAAIHPEADEKVHKLTEEEREIIFEETRGHDGCFKAIALYLEFFKLGPPGQKILIPGGDPYVVFNSPAHVAIFKCNGPKRSTVAVLNIDGIELDTILCTGTHDGEAHCALVFTSADESMVIADMSRMQYGKAARGFFGESCFVGSFAQYIDTMHSVCCDFEFEHYSDFENFPPGPDEDNHIRLQACAQAAWERWQNRYKQPWCEWCGKGGVDYVICFQCFASISHCERHKQNVKALHQVDCNQAF